MQGAKETGCLIHSDSSEVARVGEFQFQLFRKFDSWNVACKPLTKVG